MFLKLLNNAYSPYYKFPVASIVVMKDGREFSGVNVELANGTSVCAERNAIAAAITAGYKKGDFAKLYVMLDNGEIGWPCFACRQAFLEFFDNITPIISVSRKGEEESHTVTELCPYDFDAEDLKWDRDLLI